MKKANTKIKLLTILLCFIVNASHGQLSKSALFNVLDECSERIEKNQNAGWNNEKSVYDYIRKDEEFKSQLIFHDFYEGNAYQLNVVLSSYKISRIRLQIISTDDIILATNDTTGSRICLNYNCSNDGKFVVRITCFLNDESIENIYYGLTIDRYVGKSRSVNISTNNVSGIKFQQMLKNYATSVYNDSIYSPGRLETGILSDFGTQDKLLGFTARDFYEGLQYKIVAFTDSRTKNFLLEMKDLETDQIINTVDNNSMDTSKPSILGDVETIIYEPTNNHACLTIIYSSSKINKIARYGIFTLYRKIPGPPPTPSITYYIDKKTTCEYDAKTVEARNCNEPAFANDSIQVNEEQSLLKVNSNVYQIVSNDQSSDTNSKIYKITNDRNEKGFAVVNPNERYIQLVILNNYKLWSYHINSFK